MRINKFIIYSSLAAIDTAPAELNQDRPKSTISLIFARKGFASTDLVYNLLAVVTPISRFFGKARVVSCCRDCENMQ